LEYANAIGDVTNSNYTTMLWWVYTRELVIYSFMLLQALHVEIEMKNQNLQAVTYLCWMAPMAKFEYAPFL